MALAPPRSLPEARGEAGPLQMPPRGVRRAHVSARAPGGRLRALARRVPVRVRLSVRKGCVRLCTPAWLRHGC